MTPRRALVSATGCLLALAALLTTPLGPQPAGAQDVDAAERRRLADLQKERAKLERNATRAAQGVGATVQREALAWADLRPVAEGAEGAANAALLERALLQVFLREGVLVYPFEEERRLEVTYERGKLRGSLLSDDDVAFLLGRGFSFVALPLLEQRRSSYSVSLDVIDLRTGRKVSVSLPAVSAKAAPLQEVCALEALPSRNVKVLTFAAGNLGRQVDRGECWDLPAVPVQKDGGRVRGYDFGQEVAWEHARPGDVITFGASGAAGGHVVVLFKWAESRAAAWVLHQNWGKQRTVRVDSLGSVEANKPGQELRVWRP